MLACLPHSCPLLSEQPALLRECYVSLPLFPAPPTLRTGSDDVREGTGKKMGPKHRKQQKLVVSWPQRAEDIQDKLPEFPQLSLLFSVLTRPGGTSCLLTQNVTLNHNNKSSTCLSLRKDLFLETKRNLRKTVTVLCHICARHEGYKETRKTDIFRQFPSYAGNADARGVLSHTWRGPENHLGGTYI